MPEVVLSSFWAVSSFAVLSRLSSVVFVVMAMAMATAVEIALHLATHQCHAFVLSLVVLVL